MVVFSFQRWFPPLTTGYVTAAFLRNNSFCRTIRLSHIANTAFRNSKAGKTSPTPN